MATSQISMKNFAFLILSAENKTKAAKASVEIAKIAAAIDKSGAARAKQTTDDNVQKLAAAISALQEDLKWN